MIPNDIIVDWEPVGTVVKINNSIIRTKRQKTNVYHQRGKYFTYHWNRN
jgi:hypothetical protein